jgi:hypothetical protein
LAEAADITVAGEVIGNRRITGERRRFLTQRVPSKTRWSEDAK